MSFDFGVNERSLKRRSKRSDREGKDDSEKKPIVDKLSFSKASQFPRGISADARECITTLALNTQTLRKLRAEQDTTIERRCSRDCI